VGVTHRDHLVVKPPERADRFVVVEVADSVVGVPVRLPSRI
jgi:hypothetical protein